ncbi:MAG: division/cell wall cluster transcriptional repressor MraZ [Dehalococcoidia bacterium]|nr:MAG: division/cell wall cluster transcriptional repressor MraZ [Dehalococcoidia bacterium]TEU18688.1 MAG: division/cell wall cluster transcriptional repressor MraZ [Dehalococcoidia bacterium]
MFFGEYTYKVDEKGRAPLPPKFRRQMKEGVILAKGMGEKCIAAYPVAEWKRLSDSLAAKAVTPANLRRLNRAIFGSAFGASLDGQGRIILPFSLREYAGIGDTAIVVGANNCVELWSEGEWQAEKKSAEEQASEIIESFGA